MCEWRFVRDSCSSKVPACSPAHRRSCLRAPLFRHRQERLQGPWKRKRPGGMATMNDLAFRIKGRLGLPTTNRCSSARVLHPNLLPTELQRLALRIAAADGVSVTQARQQIAQFRRTPAGPKVLTLAPGALAQHEVAWVEVAKVVRVLHPNQPAADCVGHEPNPYSTAISL